MKRFGTLSGQLKALCTSWLDLYVSREHRLDVDQIFSFSLSLPLGQKFVYVMNPLINDGRASDFVIVASVHPVPFLFLQPSNSRRIC